jgi:hypothetical protein
LEFDEEFPQVLTLDANLIAVELGREFLAPIHFLQMCVPPVHVGQEKRFA